MTYYHLAELVHRRALKYKSKPVFKYRDGDEKKWKSISWKKLSEQVMKTAWSISELGTEVQERIGIYSQNMPQYLITDFAIFANRAIEVSIYATSSPSQVEYIVNDAQIHTLFVGEQYQYNNAYKVQQESSVLKRIVAFDPKVKFHPNDTTSIHFDNFIAMGESSEAEVNINVRLRNISEEDTASIIYTSGTTGEPKGVVLTHATYLEMMRIHTERLPMTSSKDVTMCFLPLAHVFEKAWTFYAIHRGMTSVINQDPKEVQKSIKQIHPTIMCSVPRFWEKVYAGVTDKIGSSKGLMKWIYTDAIKTGRKYNIEYKNNNLTPPLGTRIKFMLYNNTIFKVLKMVIGIDKGNVFPCAGAPLSTKIIEFLRSVNIPIIFGYGLTETCATVTFYNLTGVSFGSVGEMMPGVEVKLGEDNEILVKGKTIMKEYYNKPEETAKVFTEDGFFRTGDAGKIDEKGVLYLTERLKDLYKTSNGKYIAPQAIEMALGTDPFIDMIATIGDERKFVSALIVPDYIALEKWAEQNKISYKNMAELINKKEVISMIATRLELLQADFASYEKVKKFTLLAEPFTMENGELTNTLKMKRKFIAERHKNSIDKMYEELSSK